MRKFFFFLVCFLTFASFAKAQEFDPLNDLYEEEALFENDASYTPLLSTQTTPKGESNNPSLALPSIENATRGMGGEAEESNFSLDEIPSSPQTTQTSNPNDYLFAPSFSYAEYLGSASYTPPSQTQSYQPQTSLSETGPKDIFLLSLALGILFTTFLTKRKLAK